jgi:hypothetical protein
VSEIKEILAGVLGRIPRPTPAMGVALLALIIAASGAAVAAIPSADGTITACRDSRSGAIRVIDAASQTCTSKETQLRWKDGSTLLGKNEKAADSEKLDGKDSSEFLGKSEKAADATHADSADQVDGFDSSQFAGFGETVYKSRETVPRPCSYGELISKTFSVPRETLVYASATTTYYGVDIDWATFLMELVDTSSGDIIASAGGADVRGQPNGAKVPTSVQGVLHSTPQNSAGWEVYQDPTSTPLVLTPGKQYKLYIIGATGGFCDTTGSATFENISLSYQLIGKP